MLAPQGDGRVGVTVSIPVTVNLALCNRRRGSMTRRGTCDTSD